MADAVTRPPRRAAYAGAGVDVAAGERAVELLRARLAAAGEDLLGGIGGFGAALAIPDGYRRPVLVTATDGVGTKTDIARALDRLETIGRDVVAMCADDIVCHGARPVWFLDYLCVGKVEAERVARLIDGIAEACAEIGCTLVGGETAEHPGLMEADAFDLAGFCIGFVERELLLDGSACRAGDVVIGLASSGAHANGFSLVRALVERHRLGLREPYADVLARYGVPVTAGDEGRTLGEELLTPTRLYAPAVLGLRDELLRRGLRLGAMAHVTGGGLAGNVARGLPAELGIRLQVGSWRVPGVFGLLAALGDIDPAEMRATFNCGLGMTAVVEPTAVDIALAALQQSGIAAWVVGEVRPLAELGGERYREAV